MEKVLKTMRCFVFDVLGFYFFLL